MPKYMVANRRNEKDRSALPRLAHVKQPRQGVPHREDAASRFSFQLTRPDSILTVGKFLLAEVSHK